MLKNILSLEGVTLLSKEQQRGVNGGEKCRSVQIAGAYENDGPGTGTYNGGNVSGQCLVQCRPSFLNIGFGDWGPIEKMPC